MSIRAATYRDLAQLVTLTREYYEGEKRPVDVQRTADTYAKLLTADDGQACAFVSYSSRRPEQITGFITGVLFPQLFHAEPSSMPVAWYARPGSKGHGSYLMRAYERWARERGVKRIHGSGREPRTLALLTKTGYEPLELHFCKVIHHA